MQSRGEVKREIERSMRVVDLAQRLMESAQAQGFTADEKMAGAALYASAIARAYGMSREQCIEFLAVAVSDGWQS